MVKVTRVKSLKKLNNILLFMVALAFTACGNYEHKYLSVGGEWRRGQVLSFEGDFSSLDGPNSLDLYVGVRYGAAYPYKNLWLQVETLVGGDSIISCDTVRCDIYSDNGRRNGSTAGSLYQAEFFVAPVNIPWRSTHTVRLQHIMQDSLLQGIYDVGIRLASPCLHQCAEN